MANLLAAFGIAGLIGLVVGTFVLAFLWDLLTEDDAKSAAKRTAQRKVGLLSGAATGLVAIAATSLDWLLQIPSLALGAIGFGALSGMIDITPEGFAVVATLTFVLGHTVHGRYE